MNIQSKTTFDIGVFTCIRKIGIGVTSVVYLAQYQSSGDIQIYKDLGTGNHGANQDRGNIVEDKETTRGQMFMQINEQNKNELEVGQLVAIKIFKRSAINSFKRELKSYQNVIGSNILKCFGCYKDIQIRTPKQEQIIANCLILEYAENGEFFWFLKDINMSESVARFYFKSILKGVHELHSVNIAHYDLKLENIFVDSEFNIKIGDLGVSCSLQTNPRERAGTQSYRAPEYYRFKHHSGTAADIFSLGVILFILVTGKMPFYVPTEQDPYYRHFIEGNIHIFWHLHQQSLQRSKQSNTTDVSSSIINKEVMVNNTKQIIWDYSDSFKDIISNMLANDPKERISFANIIGHPWLQELTSTQYEAREEMKKNKVYRSLQN